MSRVDVQVRTYDLLKGTENSLAKGLTKHQRYAILHLPQVTSELRVVLVRSTLTIEEWKAEQNKQVRHTHKNVLSMTRWSARP